MCLSLLAGQYEDATPGNSTWETGDWNGDGDFDTSDLVAAFQAGNYVSPAALLDIAAALDWLFDQNLHNIDHLIEKAKKR